MLLDHEAKPLKISISTIGESPRFRCEDGDYRGVRCELPTGDVVELRHRRTPLYDLARELEKRGYGDCRLESFTPTGTPSLRGLVKVMAGLTVEEGPHGLSRRKYRGAKWCESATDAREAPRDTQTPENKKTCVSESTTRVEVA